MSIQGGDLDWDAQLELFHAKYPALRDEFIQYLTTEYGLPQNALDRIKLLSDENVIGGKYNRALLVTNTLQIICKSRNLPLKAYLDQGVVLGWCIEILQALFLVADDIMDGSVTRRGKPCWYKRQDVQMDAVNDTLILESFLYFLIDRHFESHPRRHQINQLFHQVSLDTEMGQMLDLMSQPQGRKGVEILSNFNLDLYHKIVKYKTALYSFYLPIACALMILQQEGENGESLKIAKELSLDLGTKFQIQDDYLDAYGHPDKIGKIGTDLRDHKCTWILVQALQRVNEKQRKVIEENLGKEEGEAIIKALYNEIGIPAIYEKQENDSYESITNKAAQNAKILPPEVSLSILNKIHKRDK